MKHLQHMYENICATSGWNTFYIRVKHMQHLEQTLATYMHSHCNICNIPIYFCNIHMKHLQHAYETLETYACNTRLQHPRKEGSARCSRRSLLWVWSLRISWCHELRLSVAAAPALTTATISWWGTTALAAPRRHEGQGMARRGGDQAWRDEAEWARQGMEHGVAAGVAWLDAGWGRRREAAWGRRTTREPRQAKREVRDFCRLSQCRWSR
jgi:hypothetical protein